MNRSWPVKVIALIAYSVITFGSAEGLIDISTIRWGWDDALLDSTEEDAEAGVREAVFGEHTQWFSCAAVNPVPTVQLGAPPVHGSFTRPFARQTLFQYIYDLCEDDWSSTSLRRHAIVEDGHVVRVAEDEPIGYFEGLSQVAVIDLNGNGLDELLRWYDGNHHTRVTIAVFTEDAVRTIAWFYAYLDDCDGDPLYGASAWLAIPKYRPIADSWPEFSLEYTVFDCNAYMEPLEDGADALADVLAEAAVDPVGSAMAVLALAWDGNQPAQLEVARMFEQGTVLPRDPELSEWWREQAR